MEITTKSGSKKRKILSSTKKHFIFSLIGLTVLSAVFLCQSWITSVNAVKKHALSTSNAAAISLSKDNIKLLQAVPADENTAAYKAIKANLIGLAKSNNEIRFVYLYTQRDGKIYFMADSEPTNSKDYSPPGQLFGEAAKVDFMPFKDGNTRITSSVTDRWGNWISVLVPIKDSQTNAVIAVLGIDYPVHTWYSPAVIDVLQTAAIVLAAYLLIIAFYSLMIKNSKLKEDHEKLRAAHDEAINNEKKALESKNEIEQQSDMQKTLLDISADFAVVDFDNIFPVINQSLERVGKAVNADRVYTFRYDFATQTCRNTFEWCAPGIEPQIDNLQNVLLSSLNDWPDIHKEGKSVIVTDVFALPKSDHIREILAPQGIKSLLAVPMILGTECFGFAGLDYVKEPHTFSEKEQQLLEQCSNMLISTFTRIKLDKDLSDSEEKYRNIFEFSPIGVFNFDTQGLIVTCNDYFVDIIGSSREALIGLELFKLPDLKIVECIKGALQGNITEYRDNYHSVTAKKVTPIRAKFSPILSQSGEIAGGTGIIEDVTERKKVQDELRLKSMVLEQLEEHITITDLSGVITYVNQAQVYEMKLPKDEIVGRTTLVYGEDTERGAAQIEILENTLQNGSWLGEVINFSADGSESIMLCRTQKICDENGNAIALAGIATNMTDRRKMERDIYKEKEQFRTTLLSVGDGVVSTDASGNLVVINRVAEELTGWTQEEAFGKPLEEVFNIVNEVTGKRCENPVHRVLKAGNIVELTNHTILISKDGTERFIEDSAAPIKDEHGNINGVVLVFRDFSDKKQKQLEIEFLSYHDQLTGLYNRRYYEAEVIKFDNELYYPLTLIMCDVNGLKLTNDAFGHSTGDLLLQKIANILKRECREQDIVARIGGDEFVLLLPKTDAENATIVIRRINEAIVNEQIENLILSVAVGFATKEDSSSTMSEIFTKAEDAMYRHKLSENSTMKSKTVDLIMKSLFERNKSELQHSKRVGALCESIAKAMNFSPVDTNQIRIAGLMHDIGKIGISEEVLNKPGKLGPGEWSEVDRHSEIGYRILVSVLEFSKVADAILEHHERLDGTGYPRGLNGQEISQHARIIAIADAYDAMVSDRPYKITLSKDEAIEEIKIFAGSQFDPEIAKVFVEKVLNEKWS